MDLKTVVVVAAGTLAVLGFVRFSNGKVFGG